MITAGQLAHFSCCFREPCRIHTSSHVYSCAGCFREGPFSPLGLPIGYNCIDFSLMSSWVGRVCSKTEKVATSCQKKPDPAETRLPWQILFVSSKPNKRKSFKSCPVRQGTKSDEQRNQHQDYWKLYSSLGPCCQHGMSTTYR